MIHNASLVPAIEAGPTNGAVALVDVPTMGCTCREGKGLGQGQEDHTGEFRRSRR